MNPDPDVEMVIETSAELIAIAALEADNARLSSRLAELEAERDDIKVEYQAAVEECSRLRTIEEVAVWVIDPNTSPFATQQEAIQNLERALRTALEGSE